MYFMHIKKYKWISLLFKQCTGIKIYWHKIFPYTVMFLSSSVCLCGIPLNDPCKKFVKTFTYDINSEFRIRISWNFYFFLKLTALITDTIRHKPTDKNFNIQIISKHEVFTKTLLWNHPKTHSASYMSDRKKNVLNCILKLWFFLVTPFAFLTNIP